MQFGSVVEPHWSAYLRGQIVDELFLRKSSGTLHPEGHLGGIWLADYLSDTWALRDYLFAVGYILLRECLLNQLFKKFVGSVFLSSFFLFN